MTESELLDRYSGVGDFNSRMLSAVTNLAELSLDFMCHLALLFLHVLYEILVRIRRVSDDLYWTYKDLTCFGRSGSGQIRTLLETRRGELSKVPNHLVIILGPEEPSYDDLAKLIAWSEALGVNFISFYDHKNGIEPLMIFKAVKNHSKHVLHKIKWGRSFTDDIKQASVKQINGYRWEGVMKVNVLDECDTNSRLVEVARELVGSPEPLERLDLARLSSLLEARLGTPSPDLALVCGPVLAYYACTPWHLRLTQFVQIRSHHNLKLTKFLNCLHQYSKAEQRYGK